jgi:hypothetical protein
MTNQSFDAGMMPQEARKGLFSRPCSPDGAQRNLGRPSEIGIPDFAALNPGYDSEPYSAGLAEPLEGFGPVMVLAAAFFSTRRTAKIEPS